MLMQSPTGSLALATPVRFCMLLWPALLAGWPINSLHGWAAYQALMVTGHLTALDKTPESSPLTLGTLGIRYLPSLFLKLLVLRTALRHVELIYFVLAYSIEAATAPHATCLRLECEPCIQFIEISAHWSLQQSLQWRAQLHNCNVGCLTWVASCA